METLVKIEINEENNSMIYKFSGELDETNTDNNFTKFYKDIENNKSKKNIFDFEKLTYMNSKTIGYLIDIYNNIEDAGGKMYIKNCKGGIKDTLHFTGVDTVIPYID